jgi:hypothetical protein
LSRASRDYQQSACFVPLVLDAQGTSYSAARPLQTRVALIAVGDQFNQGLLDRCKVQGIDVDDALVNRDRVDCHA